MTHSAVNLQYLKGITKYPPNLKSIKILLCLLLLTTNSATSSVLLAVVKVCIINGNCNFSYNLAILL